MNRFLSSCARLPRVVFSVGVAAHPSPQSKKQTLAILLLAVAGATGVVGRDARAGIVFRDNINLQASDGRGFSFSFDIASKVISSSTSALDGGFTVSWAPGGSMVFYGNLYTWGSSASLLVSQSSGGTTYSASASTVGTNPFYGSTNWDESGVGRSSPANGTEYVALSAWSVIDEVYTGWAAFTKTSDGNALQLNAVAFNDFAVGMANYQQVIMTGDTGNGMYVAPTDVANTAVPEPSTCFSLAAGLAFGGWHVFRRRRAR